MPISKIEIYTVSGKKVNLCIQFNNFHRQCMILTKFRNSNATSNGIQITKFQWNLSMSAIVIASLARWPKTRSVHYWQRHRDETVKVQKSNILKFVFRIFSACSNASSTTWMPAWMLIDDQWLKCCNSSIRRDFSWATTSWNRLRYTRSCSFLQIQ